MTEEQVGYSNRYAWPPQPVLDLATAVQIMASRLEAAWADLEAERQRVITSATMGRKAEVNRSLTRLQLAVDALRGQVLAEVTRFLTLHLGPRYQAGAEAVTGEPMAWTQAHTLALTSLAVDTYSDFLARAEQAQQVTAAFAAVVRESAALELPKIAAGGRTARQAARRLEDRLLAQGVTHVTYRNGAEVSVRTYTEMAARTKSAVAYNAGTLNGCQEAEVGWVEILDSPDCGLSTHDGIPKANGTVVDLATAAVNPIAHPNCVRAFGPRPDVTTREQAEAASSVQPDEQVADQMARAEQRLGSVERLGRQTLRPAQAARQRRAAARASRAGGQGREATIESIVATVVRSQT